MIYDIFNKMKKKMKQTSIFSVKQININIEKINQCSFVIEIINIERILINQKTKKKDNVMISCQSLS
jgi:hypothetical protein